MDEALDLLEKALESAPSQELEVAVMAEEGHKRLKRYVGIDAEFTSRHVTTEQLLDEYEQRFNIRLNLHVREHFWSKSRCLENEILAQEEPLRSYQGSNEDESLKDPPKDIYRWMAEASNERIESLCSVLVITVDRHVVFSFYILDMLENAQPTTVPAVSAPVNNS